MKKISLLAMMLVVLSLLFCAASAYTIQVENSQVSHTGETATLAITLDSADPSGFAGYDFNVSISDPSVAIITGVSFPSWATTRENSTLPASEIRLRAVDLMEQVNAGATAVPLATLTVRGEGAGTTSITITPKKITADGGSSLISSTILQTGTFTVDEAPSTGSLLVISTPAGAAISLDGTATGHVTPYTFDSMSAGTHTLALSLSGYVSQSREVTVAVGSTAEAAFTLLKESEQGSAIIADHTTINLTKVPQDAIIQAKENLHIAYGHTSHGSQITTGMTGLVSFAGAPYGGDLYRWNNGGTNDALDLRDSPFSGASDLGNPDRTAWATATRNYLNTHPDVNVIMWSWCGQVDGTEAQINTYLDLMADLEADYPDVKFIYMTGHLNGGGESGNVNLRNEQIRNYCRENNKILFDFADIESYDPDAATNYMVLFADDACNYKLNGQTRNWATEWQDSHPENVAGEPSWYQCSAAHTEPLNANMKAYAAWWLFARLAGWDGSSGTTTGSLTITSTPVGAAITLDGTETGRVTPYTFDNLNPGDHTVALNLAGYEPASKTITVVAGATVPADFTLVEIPSPTTGSIAVNSTPQGAAITLDGTETGQVTPYTFDNLNPGEHTVAVNLAGYEPASQTVTVVAGSTVPTDFTLVEIPSPTTGSIAVNSTPEGAAITLDGTETGQVTPYTFDNLDPGEHTVAVNLAGYEPASHTVTVIAGSTVNAEFTLVEIPSPTTGSIAVNSTPEGAAITLDGTETGQVTPYTFDNLNPGEHTVAVNLAGYEPASQTVTVVAGSTVNAEFTLVEIPSPTTGSIAVNSTPEGAAITLDGTETGQFTPYTFDNLNPGDHTVALNLAGYEPASQTVTVVAGSTVTADFTLVEIPSPTTGSIAVNSTPQGAVITLDGTETGQVAPYTFDNLNPGEHIVAVNLAGYEPASKTVSVIAGSLVPAEFTLVLIPTTGSLAVNSTPQGAAITLDGTETGQVTPYTFDNLNPGEHTVAVNFAGYEPATQTVAVVAGSTVPADFTLVDIPSPTTGSIAVNSTPQGAAITLDGTETGQVTPFTFDNLNPGEHTVALNLAGYEPASQTVSVVAGSTATADFSLVEIPVPTTGSIAVSSTPVGAAITLDGTETGQVAPYTFDNLNPGEHIIALNLAGYEPASQTVSVVAGSTVPADFTLVEIPVPTTGSIAVSSTPVGAAITLDGTETGQVTPYTFDNLNAGDHTVALNLAGYEPASQTVSVVAGSTVPADFTLVEIPVPTTGSIAVNSTPQGAAITLDGTETGQVTPFTFDNLNPGEHIVALNLAGYEPASQTVSVVAGSTVPADFTLVEIPVPTTGSIAVNSTPQGAAITLDGTETGQVTPFTFDNLNPGEHIVALNLAGYEPASQTVSVVAGSTVPADFTLVEIPVPTTGSIAVNSTPQGAAITLDGTETGQVTPFTFDNLNPGDHTVALNLAGYEPASQTATVVAGSIATADLTLVEIPSPTTGSIAVNSTPQGAAITLDGTETGQVTPFTFDNLNPGEHIVALNLAGYEPASQTVNVVAGSTVPADFTLVEIPSPTTGSIAVSSTPAGAAITLDGTETGQVTPYTFDNLNPGDHTVTLNLAGYEPASQTVAVVAGSTVNAEFTLVLIPTTGSLAVNSTPQGAAITLDGTETGQGTPYTFDNLNPGDHTVALNLAGYEPASQTVSVVAGSTATADFTLVEIPSPTTGSIAVNSTPEGAAITLDGTETGQVTPYTFDNLNPGDHTVALNLAGYEPASQTVSVVAGSTATADFSLVEIPSPTTGSIAVNSTPEGAAITLDGTETGQVTPYTFDNLNPGEHTVAVNLAGYEPASKTVSVIVGSSVPADFTLVEIPSPTTGSIAVNSTPEGAAITLDGTETGQVTPYTFDNLNPGEHTVAVNLAGYEPASKTVSVIVGSSVPADFTLVEIPSPTTGSIAVNSTPQGAAITLDGTETGQVTPFTFDNLNPGGHTVALNLAGYEPASQTVSVVAGSTATADFSLVEIPSPTTGSIAVSSTPTGAAITLDGTETGQVTPYTFDNLNPGEHTVALNLAGHKPASQTVSVVAGSTVPADFTLVEIPVPTTGSIAVSSTPAGAAITLDGTETGQVTPYTFDNLNAGDHTVAVNLAGYKPTSKTVSVVAGSTIPAEFTLVQIPGNAPVVKQVSPNNGETGKLVRNLQITGKHFQKGAMVKFQKEGQQDIIPTWSMVRDDKKITCMVLIPQGAEPGSWDVTVTNPDGNSGTKPDAFTIKETPAPVVKAVAPASAQAGRMIWNLQINGDHFQQGAIVRFEKEGERDIMPLFSIVLNDKRVFCVVYIPESAEAGSWDVTVTNPGGLSGTKPGAFTVKSDKKSGKTIQMESTPAKGSPAAART